MGRRIGYLVHDLMDPAVARRIAVFRTGGAEVAAAGFQRADLTGRGLPAPDALSLGVTHDARLAHRAGAVARVLAGRMGGLTRHLHDADAIVARNLEMLVIAASVARRLPNRPRLVYECLDLHRLLLSEGGAGAVFRGIERRLARSVDLVITSSPAFVDRHLGRAFEGSEMLLVENKVFGPGPAERAAETPPGPAWRIGWFGALRCRRSLDLLGKLAGAFGGKVEVILRGRPSTAIFPDLASELEAVPNMRFEGPFKYPDDLAEIYGGVHFAWSMDFYEAGQNSSWLLPNRLYESGFHRTVPIAQAGVETGRFLGDLKIGAVLDEPIEEALHQMFADLTAQDYMASLERARGIPCQRWLLSPAECTQIVDKVCGRGS